MMDIIKSIIQIKLIPDNALLIVTIAFKYITSDH